MINSNARTPIQAFPIKTTTEVFSGAITAYDVDAPLVVHMTSDGDITCHYNTAGTPGTIVIPALANSYWVIDGNIDSIDVSASCIISKA